MIGYGGEVDLFARLKAAGQVRPIAPTVLIFDGNVRLCTSDQGVYESRQLRRLRARSGPCDPHRVAGALPGTISTAPCTGSGAGQAIVLNAASCLGYLSCSATETVARPTQKDVRQDRLVATPICLERGIDWAPESWQLQRVLELHSMCLSGDEIDNPISTFTSRAIPQ